MAIHVFKDAAESVGRKAVLRASSTTPMRPGDGDGDHDGGGGGGGGGVMIAIQGIFQPETNGVQLKSRPGGVGGEGGGWSWCA